MSAIDLSICSPGIFMDFQWKVYFEQCGSDHFPIFIDIVKPLPEERVPKWQLHKANWNDFVKKCTQNINNECFKDIQDPLTLFTQYNFRHSYQNNT